MSDSKSNLINVKFSYLYRDSGNYKVYDKIVFRNPNHLAISLIENRLRALLIDGEYFEPRYWNLPSIHELPFDPALDHEWYEFYSLEETEEEVDLENESLEGFERFLIGNKVTTNN